MHRLRPVRGALRNTVMDKMAYPRGLIRFDTQNGMAARWSPRQLLRRVLRPRVLIYTAVLWALIFGLLASLVVRSPLKVDVVRDRVAVAHRRGWSSGERLPPSDHERDRTPATLPNQRERHRRVERFA